MLFVINCHPLSGQCGRMKHSELDTLIAEIGDKHRTIVTNLTPATNVRQVSLSVSKVGNLVKQAKFVVAVSSGASACLHSVFSQDVRKYLFLDDPLFLNYSGTPMPRHGLVSGMRAQLQADGFL